MATTDRVDRTSDTTTAGIEIRHPREEELTPYFETLSTAFLEPLDAAAVAASVIPLWDFSRVWAAFDGSTVAATFRSWASELTLPGGGRVPASAIAGVTTRPTHRRRGLLRRLANAEHAAARDRGEVVAMLHASEYPIYGRFGYGSAIQQATWTLDTLTTTVLAGDASRVELVSREAARPLLPAIFEAHRARQVGEIRRREFRWDDELGFLTFPGETAWRGNVAIHRDADGTPDGYARYTVNGRFEHRQPRGRLEVNELITTSAEAYADLWRFLAETDLASTVKAERRPIHERLPWLLSNARAAELTEVGDGLWLRLLDVPRALAARAYERTGQVVLEVVGPSGDALLERERVVLDAAPDGATCHPTSQSPDLTVPVAALGAALLGGTSLRWAAEAAGGADEHRTAALENATRLLRTIDAPWCSTFF